MHFRFYHCNTLLKFISSFLFPSYLAPGETWSAEKRWWQSYIFPLIAAVFRHWKIIFYWMMEGAFSFPLVLLSIISMVYYIFGSKRVHFCRIQETSLRSLRQVRKTMEMKETWDTLINSENSEAVYCCCFFYHIFLLFHYENIVQYISYLTIKKCNLSLLHF